MNGRFVDITGMRFTRLVVISLSHTGLDGQARWNCVCDCGNKLIVRGAALRKGNTHSCGCYKLDKIRDANYKNIVGQRFNNLVVLKDAGRKYGKVLWECQCDCGNIFTATAGDIRQGKYISCGCSKNWVGSKNPRWRGGTSKILYPPEWNKKLRKRIRELDFHCCRFYGCTYDDTLIGNRKLDVHHIDGNKQNCNELNLISLCGTHHRYIEEHGPNKYINYFRSITESRI